MNFIYEKNDLTLLFTWQKNMVIIIFFLCIYSASRKHNNGLIFFAQTLYVESTAHIVGYILCEI